TEKVLSPGKLAAGGTWRTRVNREASANGSGRRSTASTTLKIAVFAPIPKARMPIAAAAKPGLLRRVRRLKRRASRSVPMGSLHGWRTPRGRRRGSARFSSYAWGGGKVAGLEGPPRHRDPEVVFPRIDIA